MHKEQIHELFRHHQGQKYKVRKQDASYRLNKLKKFKKLVLSNIERVNQVLKADFRKPPVESNLTEVMPIISMINFLEKELENWMRPHKVKTPLLFKGTKSVVVPVSKGNVLIISPWNYPFQLNLYPALTSFAAGNTTIIKPSEYTPKTNELVKELCTEVFESYEMAFVEGEAQTSQDLLDLPFDHVFFTGSTQVGSIVMEKAAKSLSSVGLELGGKSPCFIDKGVNLKEASKKVMWGKLVNSGQTCIAPDYVLVLKEDEKKFIKECIERCKEFYPSEDFKENQDYAQIITEKHAKRLEGLIKDANDKGATIHYGGALEGERILAPTILSGVDKSMSVMNEEIFGPILPIISFNTLDEMIDFVNSYDNALATYLFSDSDESVDKVVLNTSSGGVTVNDTLLAVGHPHLPFGGAGKSGIGKYHGLYGLEEFSTLRPLMRRDYDLGTTYFYPPYDSKKDKIVKGLLNKFRRLF